jgi:hypothetical protein
MQFLVTVQKLSLHVGVIEPFFGTLAVYDLKTGNRMSEVSPVVTVRILHSLLIGRVCRTSISISTTALC